MTLTCRTILQSLASLLPLTALGMGRAPTQSIPRLPEPAGGGDTITIRCSCGGTFEEPVEGIESRPISQFNYGSHAACRLPHDGREQVQARLSEWKVMQSYPALRDRQEHERAFNKHMRWCLDNVVSRVVKGGTS